MKTDTAKIEEFNERLKNLFEKIQQWLKEKFSDGYFNVNEISITLREDLVSEYSTTEFVFFEKNTGEKLFSIIPYGINIQGAKARVEIVGRGGRESLVYLSEGGPYLEIATIEGNSINEKTRRPMFVNKNEGWHWVDSKIDGKTPELSNGIFSNLLERIK